MTDTAPDLECPKCAYDLRGTAEPPCPECGHAFTWQEVREYMSDQVDVKQVAWIAILNGVVPMLTFIVCILAVAGELPRAVSITMGMIAFAHAFMSMKLLLDKSKSRRKYLAVALGGLIISGVSIIAAMLVTVRWVIW